MPSERFYRLSEEKQSLIWKASMKEFISEPYEKVSINKIIRNAGISRGSFYTYFEDKKDLLSFLLEDTKKKWKEFYLECLGRTDGDIFSAMEELLEYGIDFCKNNNLFKLHRNLIVYPDAVMTECREDDFPFEEVMGKELLGIVDRSRLRDDTEDGIILLVKLCTIYMLAGFTEYYRNPANEEAIKQQYKKALKVLCNGAYKASEKDQVED